MKTSSPASSKSALDSTRASATRASATRASATRASDRAAVSNSDRAAKAPLLFIGHGSPTTAVEHDAFTTFMRQLGSDVLQSELIVIFSAHWLSGNDIRITADKKLSFIYDFGGFQKELYAIKMDQPIQGDPEVALELVQELVANGFSAQLDSDRGLDHGSWMPLFLFNGQSTRSFKSKVLQISIPHLLSLENLEQIGHIVGRLREKGRVAIIGSGNLTHNLRALSWDTSQGSASSATSTAKLEHERSPFRDFDQAIWQAIAKNERSKLMNPMTLPGYQISHPSPDHLLPLWPLLGAKRTGEEAHSLFEEMRYHSLSMRSIGWA